MPYKPGNGDYRIGLLSNPLSGRNKRHFSLFRSAFQAPAILEQVEVSTPEEIKKALSLFASREVNVVLLNGGDGTIQSALNTLLNDRPFSRMPWLAVFPSGTANMIAGDVGLGPFTLATIKKFLGTLSATPAVLPVTKRHILRLRFADGRAALHGMFFGAGAIYEGTRLGRDTKQSIGRLGEWGAGLILAKFLLALATGSKKGLHPVPVGVAMDNGSILHQNYLVLFVTTLERLFLGMKPFWSSEPGPLHYTALRVPYRFLWRTLPALLQGKGHPLATHAHGYSSHNPREVRIRLRSGFVLDGEVYDSPGDHQPIILDSAGEVSFFRLKI